MHPVPRTSYRLLPALRIAAIVVLASLLGLAFYGTLVPAAPRCSLPGAVGCPGGIFGATATPAGAGDEWFDVSMNDWGFWIIDSTTGANVSGTWTIFEGYTIHINATSLPPNTAIGGTAYHGLGVEINATGQQLLSLAAPVGKWVTASFVAPTQAYYHQHIWCTIECGPGHSSQQEYNVNIIPPMPLPHATATANTSAGAAPLAVGFSGSASSGTAPYNYSWNFGDGSAAAYGTAASHTYTLGGIYYATLTVTDAKGQQAGASATVTVLSNAAMNASLTPAPAAGLAPFGATFSVVTHGGTPPYTYAWNYGDGPATAGGNLTRHVFTEPGVYAVAVNVTDSAGAHARVLTSVTVGSGSGSLSVRLTASPQNGTTPLQTTLSAVASGGAAPYSYSWILGDGATSAGTNVSHLYNQTGLYEAVVFATDSAGHGGSAVLPIAITAPTTGGGGGGGGGDGNGTDTAPRSAGAIAPAASTLTVRTLVTPAGGSPPLAVQAIASVENGTGKNVTVNWNFGDGGSGTGLVASHTYSTNGDFTVTATVADSGGNTGTGTSTVHLGGPAIALALNQTIGDTPFAVLAGVTLVGGSGAWHNASWSWGDGTNSTGMLVSHQYALNLSGNLTIQVQAVDSAGHSVAANATVSLTGPPTATLNVTLPSNNTLPANVTFALKVRGGTGGYASQVLWSFGDATSTRAPQVASHVYNRTGHFHVVAETNDSAGHYAIASAWVNLSSSVPLPALPGGGGGGGSGWVLTGVSNPTQAAFLMMGLVGATGLAFLIRKQRRRKRTGAPPRPTARPPVARIRAAPPNPVEE